MRFLTIIYPKFVLIQPLGKRGNTLIMLASLITGQEESRHKGAFSYKYTITFVLISP